MVRWTKSMKVVKDPKAFELLADDTRRRIIYLLRAKEMTVSQIAADMGLTTQAIYHHVRKMKATGLIEVAREERVGHFIETYYRATAELFVFSQGETAKKQNYEEVTKGVLDVMARLGLIDPPDKDLISKAAKVVKEIDTCCGQNEWSDKISEMDDVPFFIQQIMPDYVGLVEWDDEQFEQNMKLKAELRGILRAACKHPAKAKPKKK